MRVLIKPSSLRGRVTAPPSKSMAHRMLICAGLANGKSTVRGVSSSQDMLATLDLLEGLGVTCMQAGNVVELSGIKALEARPTRALNCRECGSTLRFMIPVCLLSQNEVTLCGSSRLFERPLGIYEELCRNLGLKFERNENSVTLQGPLTGGEFHVAGNISSQFISGLLFALPLCREDSIIHITPPLESKPYIDMTLEAMALFGVHAQWIDGLTLQIPGGQTYLARDLTVEGDYSNAAFFEALSYLGHDVTVEGLREDSLQGDSVYRRYFAALNAGAPTQSIGQCPDLGPILLALAAAKNGCHLTDTERLSIKESDRGAAMAEELKKLGVVVDVQKNDIIVPSVGIKAPKEPIFGHGDHRVVMAMATLLTKVGGVIEGADAVCKSLPEYFEMLIALGAEVEIYEA